MEKDLLKEIEELIQKWQDIDCVGYSGEFACELEMLIKTFLERKTKCYICGQYH